ncbi:hypothetical protein [Mycobacterium montefiorense]|uniref:hypothetical protein n=1 Tax=Mycobacterium montefiorense TaxID=154654 RepID=UPI0021F2A543|nr:hypothetical protein [Mycobacterium montefiorense]MCV7429356.1 hypothetical protein [Mycobacterium montefiorense]
MARSDHPHRTPLYSVCLTCGAVLLCWLASTIGMLWLSIFVYALGAIAAVTGFAMMFRGSSF